MAARPLTPSRNPDDRSFGMRSLLRLAIWGASAAIALGLVVLASYTDVGSQRLMLAFAPGSGPTTAQLAARSIEVENETRRVAAALQSLDAERERLLTRITSLERTVEDITGSIQRQGASTGSTSSPAAEVKPSASAFETTPESTSHVTALSSDPNNAADKANLKLGVDLGGAANFDGLRLLWKSIHDTHPALFDSLHPLVLVRENRRTRAVELRLLVGPVADAEAAARLCSTLAGHRRSCQPTSFEGQQFSFATEPEPRSVAPPTRRPVLTPAPKTVRQNPQQKSPMD
jgi:hypothetical protein